ncbi:uncharacterized protein LOC110844535 isoform X2 [Folsomia candida]|uniref:uncharacterized protein LOC110844535 isoform X2 n=1 Tax=Folsomia candida TaxID=158441 RepID=UPI000B8F5B80|nr:uncharacterized protein LOC110844535 isoform X2 [Folsomia candida]
MYSFNQLLVLVVTTLTAFNSTSYILQMHSIPRWYIPLQSKLNMYRYSETLLKTRVANITQDQIDSSCLSFKFDNPPVLYGFGDKMVGYTTTNVIENSYGFNTRWEGDTRGRHYLTLRDNKSFVFFTTCWTDGKASWSVISTVEDLGEETKSQIFEHAKSLGFKEDLFLEQGYASCPKIGDADELRKNEL